MAKKEHQQNDISSMRLLGEDLAPRWRNFFADLSQASSFTPNWNKLRESRWWKTGKVGAVSVHGTIVIGSEERPAVLKIQGTKPATSEVEMIESFSAQNSSEIIRPPRVCAHFPWDEERGFEAIVVEEVAGVPVIVNHPATEKEFNDFFALYEEYQKNCIKEPWVRKPKEWSYRSQVIKWMDAVSEQAKQDAFTQKQDYELAQQGIEIIERELDVNALEFMHGHFGAGDLVVTEREVVLFSNLFWSWRIPLYDLVFHYHWWMLGMEHAEPFSGDILEKERQRWLSRMFSMENVAERENGKHLLELALLERAVPALMVDRYMMNPEKESYGVTTSSVRSELERLISVLK